MLWGRRGSARDWAVGGLCSFVSGWYTPPRAGSLPVCVTLHRGKILKKLNHVKHVSSPVTPWASFRKHLLEETFQRK